MSQQDVLPKPGEWRKIRIAIPAELQFRGQPLSERLQGDAVLTPIIAELQDDVEVRIVLELTPRELFDFAVENGALEMTWETYVEAAIKDQSPSDWERQRLLRDALEAAQAEFV